MMMHTKAFSKQQSAAATFTLQRHPLNGSLRTQLDLQHPCMLPAAAAVNLAAVACTARSCTLAPADSICTLAPNQTVQQLNPVYQPRPGSAEVAVVDHINPARCDSREAAKPWVLCKLADVGHCCFRGPAAGAQQQHLWGVGQDLQRQHNRQCVQPQAHVVVTKCNSAVRCRWGSTCHMMTLS